MSEKKKRLFYYEEAVNAFIEAPDKIEHIFELADFEHKEELDIRFKVLNLTDEEMDALPED